MTDQELSGAGASDRSPEDRGRQNRPAGPALSPDLQAHIGNRLRALYDGVLSEPVPDRFLDLLDKLEQAEKGGGMDGTGRRE